MTEKKRKEVKAKGQKLWIKELARGETAATVESRRLFFNLNNLRHQSSSKEVLVTSATVGEGKSTVAALLALAAVENTEEEVLLVDADLRRPIIHSLFGLKRDGGFKELLSGKIDLELALKDSFQPNLKIITSGSGREFVWQLLEPAKLRGLFRSLRSRFSYLIVDTPPVIPVSDVLSLASELERVLLVVKAGETPREVVKRATDLLKEAGTQILGVVLNNARQVLPYYYNYSYYHYHYREPTLQKASPLELSSR
ncbi:MAG: polysaccharide biosynthesis tyrosine autokinase [Candidatus Zixiibacteriota bacterium]|nr:MAG: polysaccharide biosynthesis tyrosine autokinase [candidate division Zixibacteria bacterium]